MKKKFYLIFELKRIRILFDTPMFYFIYPHFFYPHFFTVFFLPPLFCIPPLFFKPHYFLPPVFNLTFFNIYLNFFTPTIFSIHYKTGMYVFYDSYMGLITSTLKE